MQSLLKWWESVPDSDDLASVHIKSFHRKFLLLFGQSYPKFLLISFTVLLNSLDDKRLGTPNFFKLLNIDIVIGVYIQALYITQE